MMDATLAIYGDHVKPPMATLSRYGSGTMPKAAHRTLDTSLRKVLSDNIRALQSRSPELGSSTSLGTKAGIGQQTALRAMKGSHASNIDTIYAIARALRVEAWQLLLPGFMFPANNDPKPRRSNADEVIRRLEQEHPREKRGAK